MSQIFNVITTEFRAKGNQAIATMGSIAGGVTGITRNLDEASRMSERFGRQWQAINTTVRYALAGGIIFGLRGVLTQLKEVQNQMGLISAIGETKSGLISGNNLTDLMSQSRAGAVQSITPINDYNNSVINLLSTVQKIPKDQITPIVTDISKAAKLAQITSEDATKAFTTMNVAFGRQTNLGSIHKMAQEFFILTREAPGGVAAGQQVIGQLGQLAQVTRAAHGTPEDMFSLLLSTLRTGIPPNQAGRGLQYLIQTLAFPGQGTTESKRALGRVGITPISQMPLQERLAKVFGHAKRLGIRGNIQSIVGLDENTLADLESSGTEGGLAELGITGRGTQYLGQVFHRIHALRTALALLGQINTGQAQTDLRTMDEAAKGHVSDVNNLAKAWKRFEKQAQLSKASVAINAMALQVATAFAPILNFGAGHIVGTQQLFARHPEFVKNASLGILGLMAGVGTARFLGVGSLAKGLLGARAATDLATGGSDTIMTGLGSTPAKPLYVVVVNPSFWGKGGQKGAAADAAAGAAGGAGAAESGSARVLRASRFGAAGIALGALGTLALPFGIAASAGFHPADAEVQRRIWEYAQSSPEVAARYARKHGYHLTAAQIEAKSGGKFRAGLFGDHGRMNALRLGRLNEIRQQFSPNDPRTATQLFKTAMENINGRGYVTLDVNLTSPGGKVTRKKVHVPLNFWGKTGLPPSSKGNSRPGDRSLP